MAQRGTLLGFVTRKPAPADDDVVGSPEFEQRKGKTTLKRTLDQAEAGAREVSEAKAPPRKKLRRAIESDEEEEQEEQEQDKMQVDVKDNDDDDDDAEEEEEEVMETGAAAGKQEAEPAPKKETKQPAPAPAVPAVAPKKEAAPAVADAPFPPWISQKDLKPVTGKLKPFEFPKKKKAKAAKAPAAKAKPSSKPKPANKDAAGKAKPNADAEAEADDGSKKEEGEQEDAEKDAAAADDEEASPSAKKTRKPKDPNAPKRPPSAYLLFSKARYAAVKTELEAAGSSDAKAQGKDIVAKIGQMWKALSDDDKKPFEEEQAKLMAVFKEKMEAYMATKKSDEADGATADGAPADAAAAADAEKDGDEAPAKKPKAKKAAAKKPSKSSKADVKPAAAAAAADAVLPPAEDQAESAAVQQPEPEGTADDAAIEAPKAMETEEAEEAHSAPMDVDKPPSTQPTTKKEAPKEAKQASKADAMDETEDAAEEAASASASEQSIPGVFNPAARKFHPVNAACWRAGERVPYEALTQTFTAVEATTKRLEIIRILSNFFRSVLALTPQDLVMCIYLCTNQLGPSYEGLELGIGDMILMKAVAEATGRSPAQIKSEVQSCGDLGDVAMSNRGKQATLSFMKKPTRLTVEKVFGRLREIANLSGHKVQAKKTEIIKGVLVACQGSEAKYFIRALTGKLRIHLAEQSVLVSIAHAFVLTPPAADLATMTMDTSVGVPADKFKARLDSATLTLKTVYSELPNYDKVIPALMQYGFEELHDHCSLTPGIPLKPMLAHPTKGVGEILKRFDTNLFVCEYKYDGERAQLHRIESGEMFIYSRNQENNTSKYPDIISRINACLGEEVKSFIIDCEAVAYDVEKKQILPFQVLSTRKRKDADVDEIKVQVCLFAFDLLYLNGRSYVKEPLKIRREALHKHFVTVEGEFMFATSLETSDMDVVAEFLDQSVKGNCEGLMVKTLEVDATYDIAKRSHSWLKLKKDYLEGVGDTLDLVVLGGWKGKGKRTGSYGGFLLACYDAEQEEYVGLPKPEE